MKNTNFMFYILLLIVVILTTMLTNWHMDTVAEKIQVACTESK